MRLIHLVLRHPVAVLALFATAFVVWLWRDAVPARRRPTVLLVPAESLTPPPVPLAANVRFIPDHPTGVLAKLKPGMPRAEVENLIGTPESHDIHPATVADGKVTYRTAYGPRFGSTRQPPHPAEGASAPKGLPLVTLEFDATKPGHPLLAVHSPDLRR